MASFKNFQSDNAKHSKKNSRNIFNPEFNPTVVANSQKELLSFNNNIEKWRDLVSFYRWFPDLWWDLLTPETGGINLDLDQRVFMRAMARFYSIYGCFPRGYGKCVTGDTLIYTSDGIKEIGSFFDYQNDGIETYFKHSINVLNKNSDISLSNMGVYSGRKKTIKVLTNEGYEIEGTLNHPLLTINDNGEHEYKKLENIKNGDYICINRTNDLWGTTLFINANEKSKNFLSKLSKQQRGNLFVRELPTVLTEDLALFLGYLVGDGCITLSNVVLFTNKDKEIVDNFLRISKDTFKVNHIRQAKGRNINDYIIADRYFRKYLEYIGLSQVNSFGKEIPKIILESPKNIVKQFIKGLYDTDGGCEKSTISYCTVSKKLAKQLQIVLLNFGIISKKYKKTDKNNRFSYIIQISGINIDIFNSEIGFGCSRKQKRLEALCSVTRNTNLDIIPYQFKKIKETFDEIKKYNPYLDKYMTHQVRGKCNLTYKRLDIFMNRDKFNTSKNFVHFNAIKKNHYFYSKVTNISESENDVYDIQVPNENSFIGNGIVNHNTILEVMVMFHTCVFFPNMEFVMTAQTRENAAALLQDKYNEIIKFYPLFKEEIYGSPKFQKDIAEIEFRNGSKVDVLANNQSSKGRRRKRIMVEESALLDNKTYEDVLEPIPNVPRRTIGKKGNIDPCEMNGQNHFLTTTGFASSDEYYRCKEILSKMKKMEGYFVIGSSWELACFFGRGENISRILEKKSKISPIAFARNYKEKWVGATDSCLVNSNKLMNCRSLLNCETDGQNNYEYVLGVDVARSVNSENCQSSVAIIKIVRSKNGKIKEYNLPNLFTFSGDLNFTAQAVEIKKIKEKFNAKAIIVDSNGLGAGLIDALLKESFDPTNGESLGCWNTINTDEVPEIQESERCLYSLKPQSFNSEIIANFIDIVESSKLRLLEKKSNNDYDMQDHQSFKETTLPFIQTDFLIEETINLKIKHLSNGNLSLDKEVKNLDKDRISSVLYGLWYAKTFMDRIVEQDDRSDLDYLTKYIMW